MAQPEEVAAAFLMEEWVCSGIFAKIKRHACHVGFGCNGLDPVYLDDFFVFQNPS
jgi:hypothetical protein